MARGSYAARMDNVSVSTAITILQVTAPSTAVLEIIRAWCSGATTTSASQRIQLLRKTAAATGTTAVTPAPLDGSAAAGATSGRNATGEGTDGTVLIEDIFNVVVGWLYLPVPEERIWVPPSGVIAIKFPAAPAATNFTAGIAFRELS
jgi:hypothetical protein